MALNPTPGIALTPSSTKTQLPTNYTSLFDFSHQYQPDLYEELATIYGNQSIAGQLRLMQAEKPVTADQFIWSEKGRLHTVYKDVTRSGSVFTKANHVFRVGEKVYISDGTRKATGTITAVDTNTFTVAATKAAGFGSFATSALTVFVFGSEFRKGTQGMKGSLETDITILKNKPVIMKDLYEVSGSDATNISWIRTSEGGYLWYMQSEADTRRRWEDRLELMMLLSELAEAGSDAASAGLSGTEGLINAVESRGNVYSGVPTVLGDWDTVIKRFDAQGKLDSYLYHADRDASLAVDNLLGTLNAGYSSGVSYGLFENSEEMAVNLGFRGFKRGTYNIFKQDMKAFNDPTLIGALPTAVKVRALMCPVGTKEVYEGDSVNADRVATPYLQIRYKVAGSENRKYKTWVTGSVGGVHTDDYDVMRVHELSERGFQAVGANNFMLMQGA